jgi:2-polyprenyl-6-methoxyphenol hydroxylase-like FAD-dependent oxidoreductase
VGLAALDPAGRRWNATVVVDARTHGREVAGDPAAFALARVGAALEAVPRLAAGPWTSGPFDWPARRAVADGTVLVGDAAGYYDPLTGQGIFRALRSAELAADAIDTALRAGRALRRDLAPYERAFRRELAAPLRVQHGVEAVVSRGPLRRAALALLGRRPRPMDALIAVTGDLEPPRALLRPAVWADLLGRRRAS